MKATGMILFALALLTGCVSARLARLTKPEGRYTPAIFAAASADFSSDRAASLRGIAAKNDLTEAEQLYLIEVLQIAGGFSSDKKEVLLALLSNDAVTAGAKKLLSETLPKFELFSDDTRAVADALAR